MSRIVIESSAISDILSSAQWGFHPGGWGKPPLDEYNRPLYGDVFGVLPKNTDADVSSTSHVCTASDVANFTPDL